MDREAWRISFAPLQPLNICLSAASYAKRLIISERSRNPHPQHRPAHSFPFLTASVFPHIPLLPTPNISVIIT